MEELVKWVKVLVYLETRRMTSPDENVKAEVLLSRAGLGNREIADFLGKNYDAVSKAISRAK